MSKNFRWWFSLLLVLPFYSEAETHAEVQAALDWELPVNKCDKPNIIARSSVVAGSAGDLQQTDVDSNTIRRHERKLERFESCVDEYKEALLVEFDEMKNCAQYGLTSEQADIILGKMALMQKVYLTADGIVEEAVD
jgi:hypothetical protein